MRWSESFIFTLKEAPKDAETVSQRLMHQAGMIDKVASGIYTFLPSGLAVLQKISAIIRKHLNACGCQEILMPALQPASLWEESGRWGKMGQDMITFKDRHERRLLLGPTHEEVVSDLVRKYVKSGKHLPVILYQIQTKFRDEIRPRFGIIRAREFLMKDAYSFDMTDKDSESSYQTMRDAYIKIFSECGLSVEVQTADSGVIGGKFSEEFVASGECAELEVGHIFKLGTEYSKKMKVLFTDSDGTLKPVVMGCYGIGVSRILSAVIEGNYDKAGIIWPFSLAPWQATLIPINTANSAMMEAAMNLHDSLVQTGWNLLLDDRKESAGVKFADADLLGIPIRIVFGKKLSEGKVEIKMRNKSNAQDIPLEGLELFLRDTTRNASV
ncbi:MAG: proline--tRNA ligase [Candidatus Ratteibacteria bacterium]